MRHAARTPIVARTGTLLVAAVLSLSACAATPPVEAPARPRPSAPTVTPAAPERFTSSVGAFVPTLPAAPVARIDWQSTGVMAASRLGVLYVEHPEYPRPDGVCPLVGGSADRCALFSFAPYATPGTSPEDWLRVPARAISAWSVPKRASSDWVSLHSGRDFVYGVRRDGTLEAIDDRGQSTPLVSGEKLPFRWELLRPTSVDVFETATSTVVVGRERAGKQSLFVLSLAIDHATVRVTSERFSRLPMTAWAIDDRAEDPGPGKRLFTAWTADLLLDASGAARPEWALVWWEKLAGEKEVAWVTVVGDNGGVLRESKLAVRRGPIRTRPARGGLVVEGTPVDDRGRKRGPAAKDPDSVPVPAFAREGVQLESLVTTGFDRASAQGIVVAYQNALVARAFGADGAPSGDLTRVTDSPISPEEAVRVGDDWVALASTDLWVIVGPHAGARHRIGRGGRAGVKAAGHVAKVLSIEEKQFVVRSSEIDLTNGKRVDAEVAHGTEAAPPHWYWGGLGDDGSGALWVAAPDAGPISAARLQGDGAFHALVGAADGAGTLVEIEVVDVWQDTVVLARGDRGATATWLRAREARVLDHPASDPFRIHHRGASSGPMLASGAIVPDRPGPLVLLDEVGRIRENCQAAFAVGARRTLLVCIEPLESDLPSARVGTRLVKW